ncbi:MAG: pyridoxamine 5'-phosphate oxidase family protein [Methanomicrobiales archaeon]|nr:pyridoxamine 5'-phosphate oxidase family protein [Methanomicrobiales archaeon]
MALAEKILEVIGGTHPAAVATLDQGKPAVRFMMLTGSDDMTLVGATMTASRKVAQLKKNPDASIAIWSGREVTDPYVVMKAKGTVIEDLAMKKKYWNPMMEPYFKTPDNPAFVFLVFTAIEVEYHGPNMAMPETWTR